MIEESQEVEIIIAQEVEIIIELRKQLADYSPPPCQSIALPAL